MIVKLYEFAIIASGQDIEDEAFTDAVFEVGCDDATLSFQKGVIVVEFARESTSFAQAIWSACAQLQKTGLKIERIEPDYLVSLSEIADRSNLSRQAISLYIRGERQQGFPNPTAKVTSKHPLWDWPQVADWLFRHSGLDKDSVVQARVVKEANLLIGTLDAADNGFIARLEQCEAAEILH
ncbi:MAG: hypothetical protein EP348_00335 [Alphaproteobacteria bacterium]|nr:MAG: hypothetical protein EP348_00335 [Alphaproteobacteria bacterium]